jgi:hypothetical protein
MKHIRGFFGIDTTKLTDAQKADVSNYTQKMADLEKEFINKMVSNGSMTKEKGDAAIKGIDDALKNGTYSPAGMGKGFGKQGDRGKHGDFQNHKIDTSKLTDTQKSDLEASYKKIADIQKELINKQVSEGLITQTQAEEAIKRIDENLADGNNLDDMGRFGFGFNHKFGCEQSELTDTQKAEIKDYSKKIADIQKEIINKEVSFGLLTKDQGDKEISRIDNMSANTFQPNCNKGMERGRKGMNGNGFRGNTNKESGTTPKTTAPTTSKTSTSKTTTSKKI